MAILSEAQMRTIVNREINEDTYFENSEFYIEAGGQFSAAYTLDDERVVALGPSQELFVEQLIYDNNIEAEQRNIFIRLVWDKLVELEKTR